MFNVGDFAQCNDTSIMVEITAVNEYRRGVPITYECMGYRRPTPMWSGTDPIIRFYVDAMGRLTFTGQPHLNLRYKVDEATYRQHVAAAVLEAELN